MITKYQAMMATLPIRSVSCEVQAVEDRVRVLRHSLFMLEELDMLTFTECRTLAKPLYALENQVYRLLSEINEAELELVRYTQWYDQKGE